MTTLTKPPVSTLLERLFAQAKTADSGLVDGGKLFSAEELKQLRTSTSEYLELYARMKDLYLSVSKETGQLLYMLARASKAQRIVEYGTSFGLSTIHLAAALRDNGGGQLIGSEFEPSKIVEARENLAAAGLSDLVEIREGDALKTLARDLPTTIDLLLLDGAKALYPKVLSLVEPRLQAGAIIVADNADDSPDYLAQVRASGSGYLSVPFGDDVELTVKIDT